MRQKILEGKKLEWSILVLFAVSYIIITIFHEPWFDEAQAWQLAKNVSLKDLFLETPHYEGHPPLWWLILAIPAKLGVSFELGLKTIGFIISIATVYIILFRSKLSRIARLLLPFSFFVFYQYGVIVRPYGLMLLLLILLGQEYPKRNVHPWRFAILLIILCLTSAYGIVIAGGVAICMVWEIIKEKGMKKSFYEIISDNRSRSLLVLLLVAIVLILEIMPREDTWVTSATGQNSRLICLLCTVFTFLGDCIFTDSYWFKIDTVLLQNAYIPIPSLIAYCGLGVIIWILIVSAGSKRNLKLFVLPYLFFSIFSAFVYVSAHHLGIALAILLFWLEIDARDEDRFEIGKIIMGKICHSERDVNLLKKCVSLFAMACLLIPIYWTISASFRDIKYEYGYGRSASAFIENNQLDDCLFLSSWGENSSEYYGEKIGHDDYLNTDENGNPVLICAYLEHNIFFNLGDGSDNDAYMHFSMADYETSQSVMAEWASLGYPDALLGKPDLEALYGNNLSYDDYSLVFVSDFKYVWKNQEYNASLPIFLRNDLLEGYGLEPKNAIEYTHITGLRVTDEMRKEYEDGTPIEEVIKPYLDALFGE